MRLKIFWRVILAQDILIILILMVSLYALSQLNWLTHLNANILTIDASVIDAKKQLLRIFLSQMRPAEKYLLLNEEAFSAGSRWPAWLWRCCFPISCRKTRPWREN